MASIVTYDGGLRRIEFSRTPNGPRQIIRVGRMSVRTAATIKAQVEAIVADKLANRPHDAETSKWLGNLDETMLGRLRAVGLADGVGLAQTALGAFLEQYIGGITGKPATVISYKNVRRNLEEFFGAGKMVRDITASDADAWRAWLSTDQKLAPATAARRIIAARTMWRKAIRWKLAAENPFAGIKAGNQENDARKMFIRRDVIDKLIAEAPDAEWKLIIALARFGGLRTPSEHFALKWGHVDWERGRFTVYSPKTEHHCGKGSRTVPIFRELLPYLREAFEQAAPGTEYVIARHRLGSLNLRQQFERMILRAGLTAWPRLFQNLRASRETELMREYDLATACKWIGNSPAVAAKHYAMSVDLNADFSRAAGKDHQDQGTGEAHQKAQQTAATTHDQRLTDEGETPLQTAENPALGESGQLCVTADNSEEWAVQGSNL